MEQSKVHSSVRNHLTIQTFTQISSFTSSPDDKSECSAPDELGRGLATDKTKILSLIEQSIYDDESLTGAYWTANVPCF